MSTLAIRRLIRSVKETDLGKRIPARLAQAEEDVESIESAAREFSEHGEGAQSSAWQLMERIAKESAAQTDGTCRCPPRPYWPPGSMVSGTGIEERAHEKWEREHGSHESAKRRRGVFNTGHGRDMAEDDKTQTADAQHTAFDALARVHAWRWERMGATAEAQGAMAALEKLRLALERGSHQ